MKILPRIDVLIEDDVNKYSKVHEFINDYIGPDSFSYKKARNMFNHALKTKIYSYWS